RRGTRAGGEVLAGREADGADAEGGRCDRASEASEGRRTRYPAGPRRRRGTRAGGEVLAGREADGADAEGGRCDRASEASEGRRTRTFNQRIKSPMLYH